MVIKQFFKSFLFCSTLFLLLNLINPLISSNRSTDEEFNEDSDEESEDEKPKKAQKEKVNRSGRAARTAAVKKKPTYVDTFDDSDEEWIGESESEDERAVKKAKSRGKKKRSDSDGSDWEMEYKGKGAKSNLKSLRTIDRFNGPKSNFSKPSGKGRGSRRRAASSDDDDDESGSDWERSTSRKPARKSKPAAKRTPASRKSSRSKAKKKGSDSEEEEMDLSEQEEEKVERKMCKKNCGRKNPSHLKQFAHPGEWQRRLQSIS